MTRLAAESRRDHGSERSLEDYTQLNVAGRRLRLAAGGLETKCLAQE